MHTYFVGDRQMGYEGVQLSPHWIYRTFDLLGDTVVAFLGPCRVELSEMVDLEDVKAEDMIYSPLMLHFIAEFFHMNLEMAVYRQRMLIVAIKEQLEEVGQRVVRKGDDLYLPLVDGSPGKLSVSIATASATSTLIHVGLNVETEGTPVPTVGLAELGVEVEPFARAVLACFAAEVEDIRLARCKVRAVSE